MEKVEERVEYIEFDSILRPVREKIMQDKIAEIESEGWRFIKAQPATLLKTTCSLGGGINLHFKNSAR